MSARGVGHRCIFSMLFAQEILIIVPRGFSHAPPCVAPHMPMKKPGWPVTAFLSGMAGRVLFAERFAIAIQCAPAALPPCCVHSFGFESRSLHR